MLDPTDVVSRLMEALFWDEERGEWDAEKELKSCVDVVDIVIDLLSETQMYRSAFDGAKATIQRSAPPIYRVWVDVEECLNGVYTDVDAVGGSVAACKDLNEALEIARELQETITFEPVSEPTAEEILAADLCLPERPEEQDAQENAPDSPDRKGKQLLLWEC